VRRFAFPLLLFLAGCGSASDDSIEPVPEASGGSANDLMRAAEEAAGNAQGRMSAEAGNGTSANLQGETRQ